MNGMNRVYIMGRLGHTPELQAAKNGESFCRLSVATTRTKDHTDWHSVFVFGKLAETCAKYLRKGGSVLVEGRLTYWQDGVSKVYSQSIRADEVQFLTTGPHLDNSEDARNPDAVAHPA